MNILYGYITLSVIVITRGAHLRRRLPSASASSSASASAGPSSASASSSAIAGLAGIGLNAILGRGGLLTGQPSVNLRQLQLPASRVQTPSSRLQIQLPVSSLQSLLRPRAVEIQRQAHPLASLPAALPHQPQHISAFPPTLPGSMVGAGGLPASFMFDGMDSMDPYTPDMPDIVYAPRSMMRDMRQVEMHRRRMDADGVMFV